MSTRTKKKPATGGVTRKDHAALNTMSSGIAGMISNLNTQLGILEAEIKADRKGAHEYQTELRKLDIEREDVESRLNKNKEFAKTFDEQFGPFMARYDDLTTSIRDLYDNAKTEHMKGVDLLVDAFNYHPLFRKTGDTFNAVPFKPK